MKMSHSLPNQPGHQLLLRIGLALGSILLFPQFGLSGEDGPRVREIEGTIHNLSTTGPGDTRAIALDEICKFCHTPHAGSNQGVLFNKPDTQAPFIVYNSPSLDGLVNPPGRESRLCLTCHDGTIALGDLLSEGTTWEFPPGREFLDSTSGGLDPMLRDDHPVSFLYDAGLAAADENLAHPATLPPELPLSAGRVECSTCHAVHNNTLGYFMQAPWTDGSMCETCHDRTGWLSAGHRTANRPDHIDPDPASGCRSCHRVHFANLDTPLLSIGSEETGCYQCHSTPSDPGNPAAVDVADVFALTYHHPVEQTSGVHEPDEDPFSMVEHVECADCHNPHAARSGSAMDAMAGVSGIDAGGLPVDPALDPQEVCYRCHGLAPETVEDVPRLFGGSSIREQFGTGASSFHPVDRDAAESSPSLRPEWQMANRIDCMDCHNSPAGGGFASGPHGSSWPFILEREYRVDGTDTGGFQDAALCDKCHDVAWIIDDRGPFDEHGKHFKEGVLCGSCHAAHGVVGNYPRLINFDLRVVEPFNGVIEFVRPSSGNGSCTLRCHGEKHDDENY